MKRNVTLFALTLILGAAAAAPALAETPPVLVASNDKAHEAGDKSAHKAVDKAIEQPADKPPKKPKAPKPKAR